MEIRRVGCWRNLSFLPYTSYSLYALEAWHHAFFFLIGKDSFKKTQFLLKLKGSYKYTVMIRYWFKKNKIGYLFKQFVLKSLNYQKIS